MVTGFGVQLSLSTRVKVTEAVGGNKGHLAQGLHTGPDGCQTHETLAKVAWSLCFLPVFAKLSDK